MPKNPAAYPFVPRSTVHLEPGHYWSIPLSNGQYACGRVIQMELVNGKKHSRVFLAGLMDWVGAALPDAQAIAGKNVLEQGAVHLKTIKENGGAVLGFRELGPDGIEPWLFLDRAPGNGCLVQRGFELLGPATTAQRETLRSFRDWGFRVIKILAEKHFVEATRTRIRK